MNINKITKKLSMILSKEITQIELSIPNFISDTPLEKSSNSVDTFPVSNNGYIPILILFSDFDAMESEEVKFILTDAKIRYVYNIIPAIAADVTEEQILKLVELAQVEMLSFDDYITANLDTAREWFEIDKAVKTFGVTGNEGKSSQFTKKDNVIAILDTGIDTNHIDLGSGKVIGWHDEINPVTTTPYDDNGHGTHVSSIAAGLGKAIWDYRGVAYGAALVGVKVLDANGFGTYSQIIAGIEWCVNNKNTYGIKVINMSLGGPPDSIVRMATTAAINNGIVVVCAAGNSGSNLNTIGSPGDTPLAITVGNMSDIGQGGYFLVPSSSRGPIFDNSVKPDIVAPGFNITAAKAGTTNQYITLTGTSMASPFVAGLVSLILDASGLLTPIEIKQILTNTAELWGSIKPNNDYGYGRVMPFDALKKVCKKYSNNCYSLCHNINCCCCANSYDDCEDEIPCLNPNHFSQSKIITQPNTQDWYEFYVEELGYPVGLTLIVNSSVPGTNADLFVYDSNFNLIVSSSSTSRQDTITFVPDRYGKYLIRIVRSLGNSVNYNLDISVFGNRFRCYETK